MGHGMPRYLVQHYFIGFYEVLADSSALHTSRDPLGTRQNRRDEASLDAVGSQRLVDLSAGRSSLLR